jgi:microcystin degradation protein MlrC
MALDEASPAFCPDYASAREAFLAAAQAAGAELQTIAHPLTGLQNEALGIDLAWLGPRRARRVLLSISGTHGVEGLHGSGCQTSVLRRLAHTRLPPDTALLCVHALNPYGFSWLRRVNEDNIDVNRNYVDFSQAPANPAYAELHALLQLQSLDPQELVRVQSGLEAHMRVAGPKATAFAITGGQYTHPDGIFYGGRELCWSNRALGQIAQQYLQGARLLCVLDHHTGLGPHGHTELICRHPVGSTALELAREWWGADVTSPQAGESSSAVLGGSIRMALVDLCPRAQVVAIALEVGTQDQRQVIAALLADNWLHQSGQAQSAQGQAVRQAMRNAFFSDDAHWQQQSLRRALSVYEQGLAGMQAAPLPPLRVGICGFFLECNRWSPITTAAMFAHSFDLGGQSLREELAREAPRTLGDVVGFTAEMNRLGPWEPVALRMAGAQPGGPAEQAFFEGLVTDIEVGLRQSGPLDAVFISSHGAALCTHTDDPDGELFERIRAVVGPEVPVVAVLDLHTNVSERMTRALSAFVAYRSNPHVDLRERGIEAARHLHTLLARGPGVVELVKLPFVPASTTLLTAAGTPYGMLIAGAQARVEGSILNVSLCGGFAFSDCAKCGFSVVVSACNGKRASARQLARVLAQEVWEARQTFVQPLTPIDEAVAQAVQAGLGHAPRLILADVADNPGGGGGGNTTALLQALRVANAQGVLLGVFTDAALARQAHERGVGARFEAVFNREAKDDPFAQRLVAPARVLALSDGAFLGRRGMVQGSKRQMGPSALLDLQGIRVAVISLRQQLLDPAQLDVLGVDLDQVRTLVVKSRGHFRAAFEDFAPPGRILEVDCPGLTTPNLKSLPWQHLPRPVYPIDESTTWSP